MCVLNPKVKDKLTPDFREVTQMDCTADAPLADVIGDQEGR
jgi:hypothetical protein